ncbi:holo-ACP synthase [Streptococcus chenjunshii]|uniref:Holo-[acyl-carrier-protein] synthase n=1 Tax=Streptococcus chenjunshii TaxID=2173853 RepID=A0A372KN29_9STRE|nr:holo-ACP synthase [Streptococcus chenjunshii]AXQ78051.1 holo-ACP synthase [Streptococcus chenjunshii]RFU51146.1 holo-ACP synthase [Streptococcus chenjunshii]RFU53314.1 holo-ACP synthase [Streptococcus chenjunshii]
MIVGHGIDLQAIDAVAAAYQKNNRFAQRILTEEELAVFQSLAAPKRQMEYLAGRWAAKEAFSKALGTGIGAVGFRDIEILANAKGAPVVTRSPFAGRSFVSLSHSGNFVQASVILEAEK